MAQVFNSSTWKANTGQMSDFKAILAYRTNFKMTMAIQRNPVSKSKQTTTKISFPVIMHVLHLIRTEQIEL